MEQINRSEAAQCVYEARRNLLCLSQSDFATYLNKNKDIKSNTISQGTISKYERDSYPVPPDILLHCLKLLGKNYSFKEYSKDLIVDRVKLLDPIEDSKALELIHQIVTLHSRV